MPAPRPTRAAAVAAALSAALVVGMATTAVAAEDDKDCRDFVSEAAAQAYFDTVPGDPDGLDANGDGQACEEFDFAAAATARAGTDPSASSSPAVTPTSTAPAEATDVTTPGDRDCADFATQADAQAALTADPTDPDGLDANDNGVACEDAFGTEGQQVAVIPKGAVDTGGTSGR